MSGSDALGEEVAADPECPDPDATTPAATPKPGPLPTPGPPPKQWLALIVPAPFDTVSGGYIYDRRLVEGLRALGHDVAGDGEKGAMDLVPGRGAVDSPGRFSRCVVLSAFAAAMGRW